MLRIYKLLSAVVLLGFVGCTNDVTEDVAVTLPSDGAVKTLTVALDGTTRVALGEKTAEGKYPVEWQEGDVLRVNEGATTAIAIGSDKSVAQFTFAVADAEAYNVVYPYVEGLEAATEGYLPVQFAAVQNYTEGTFDAASFPMYGATTDLTTTFGLDYLAGVLCLKVKGEGEVLKSITFSVTEGAIAGVFDVNCATGAIKAQEGALQTMTYMLPEGGVALSAEPALFYVALPAGDYKTMVAKLNTADVAMSLGVPCTGEKCIVAGAVREFAPITFKANDTADHAGEVFEISDEASLLKFALLVADNNFTYDTAAVTTSFEVTGTAAKAWGPIEGFEKTFEGNNNTISGMKAPLFGTTTGTIQNLKLKSSYTVDGVALFGAVAQTVAEGGAVVNCSLVEGSKLTISGTTKEVTVGGLVGVTYGTLTDLTNEAEVEVVMDNIATNLHVGGVVGKTYASLENCDNRGSVAVNATVRTLQLGGVTGRMGEVKDAAFTSNGCDNTGDITLSAETLVNYNLLVGGIVGITEQYTHTISNSLNTGVITSRASIGQDGNLYVMGGVLGYGKSHVITAVNGIEGNTEAGAINLLGGTMTSIGADDYFAIGGVIGYNSDDDATMTMQNLTNHAPVTVEGVTNNSGHRLCVGGVVGKILADKGATILTELTNATNNGEVTVSYGSATQIIVAGVAGLTQSATDNIVNNANVTFTATGNTSTVYVAGGVGYRQNRRLNGVTNHGDILYNGSQSYTSGRLLVAGVNSYNTQPFTSLHNTGNVTVLNANAVGRVDVGGVLGDAPAGYTSYSQDFSNTGDITVTGKNSLPESGDSYVDIAGCMAYGSTIITVNEEIPAGYSTNSGDINVDFDAAGSMRVGGVVGYSHCGLHGAVNTGNVTVTGDCLSSVLVAGVEAYEYSCYNNDTSKNANIVYYEGTAAVMNDLTYSGTKLRNEGIILVDGLKAKDGITYVGGVAGYVTVSNRWCKNDATVTVQNADLGELRFGGVVGYSAKYTIDSSNEKAVTLKSSTCEAICIGGFAGQYNYPCYNNVNNGAVLVDSDVNITGNKLMASSYNLSASFVGGLVGLSSQSHGSLKTYDNVNNGTVTMRAASAKNLCVGGVTGYTRNGAGRNTNSKSATVLVSTPCDSLFVAGVVGTCPRDDSDKHEKNYNYADITVSSASNYDTHIGGIFGYVSGATMIMVNEGNITYSGSTQGALNVGGLIAYNYSSRLGRSTEYVHENRGEITVSGSAAKRMAIGGALGLYTPKIDYSAITNTSKISVTADASCGSDIFVGGVIGLKTYTATATSVGRVENSGVVYCAATTTSDCYIGGVFGGVFTTAEKVYTIVNAINKGRVRCDVTAVDAYVGAIGGAADCVDQASNVVDSTAETGSNINCSGTLYLNGTEQYGYYGGASFMPKSLQ